LHFRVFGKGSKTRYVPVHAAAAQAISDYLEMAGHGEEKKGALFRPVSNNRTGTLANAITGDGIYKMLKKYAAAEGVKMDGLCLHALRATAATNALEHSADIAFVQMWLVIRTPQPGHFELRISSGPISEDQIKLLGTPITELTFEGCSSFVTRNN